VPHRALRLNIALRPVFLSCVATCRVFLLWWERTCCPALPTTLHALSLFAACTVPRKSNRTDRVAIRPCLDAKLRAVAICRHLLGMSQSVRVLLEHAVLLMSYISKPLYLSMYIAVLRPATLLCYPHVCSCDVPRPSHPFTRLVSLFACWLTCFWQC
jgi:hypothetical protein